MTQTNQTPELKQNADGSFNSHYPLGDKYATVRTINSAGLFGSGPNVVFFDRVHGGDNAPVAANSPEIGTWSRLTNSGGLVSRTSVVGGRSWMTLRDPLKVSETAHNTTPASFLIPATTEFYFSARIFDDSTKIMVGADSVGAPVTQTNSIWKPFWMGDQNNTAEIPDIVVGTWVGGGAFVGGNTNQPKKASDNSLYYYPSIGGKPYAVGYPLLRGYYQSGRESSAGAKDATIELFQSTVTGTSILTAPGDPYAPNAPGTGIVDFNYREMMWAQYFGNLTNSTEANIQALGADFYCATGSNSRARVIASNNAVLTSSTVAYDIPPLTWTANQITFSPHSREDSLGYYHVVLGNGTILQNVSAA